MEEPANELFQATMQLHNFKPAVCCRLSAKWPWLIHFLCSHADTMFVFYFSETHLTLKCRLCLKGLEWFFCFEHNIRFVLLITVTKQSPTAKAANKNQIRWTGSQLKMHHDTLKRRRIETKMTCLNTCTMYRVHSQELMTGMFYVSEAACRCF